MLETRIPLVIPEITAINLFEEQWHKTIDDRVNNYSQYSLGFESLDKLIHKPASIHELSILAGESGTGKSLIGLAMEMQLLIKGTCVLKIFSEMGKMRNHDRFYSMALNRKNKNFNRDLFGNPSYGQDLKFQMSEFRNLTNRYYPCDDRNLSVFDLPSVFNKAKEYFKSNGVLPKDEYMIVFIDLLSLLKDWGVSAGEIENSLASLNRIIGDYPVHIVGLVQTNDSVQRNFKQNDTSPIEAYYQKLHHIKNSAAYKERARDVLILNRPSVLAERIGHPYKKDLDFMDISLVKSNDGELGSSRFVFDTSSGLSIKPFGDFDVDEFETMSLG